MKRILQLLILLISVVAFGQQQTVAYEIDPCTFSESNTVTLKFDGTTIDESSWGVTNNELYLWAWSFDTNNENIEDCPTNGVWTNSNNTNLLTYNSTLDEYSISFVPTSFYSRTGIGRIGFLVKAKDGTGDKKTQDMLAEVGSSNFQVNRTSPLEDNTLISSGDTILITSENTCGNANYTLKANGTTIATQNNTSSFSFSDSNITENRNYQLEVTIGTDSKTQNFSALLNHNTVLEIMPEDYEDGINYDPNDPTKATLVLYATNKNFVYVAGSFNNWQPTSAHAMKRDFTRNNKFWLTLTGLTPGQIETYQYWVVDETPVANSSSLVKTADPYSTLVLDKNNDQFIMATNYPNMPNFPAQAGGNHVSVLQTNQTEFTWQSNAYTRPDKENLVVYEMLIRDFTEQDSYLEALTRLDYLVNLGINAIELMPVSEFSGNDSWGYNPIFHMALDKAYGTKDHFKQFVDACHEKGIAVLLDVVYNQADNDHPLAKMYWNETTQQPASDNPFLNVTARHPFNVFHDFNHENAFTKAYVKKTLEYWINEFRIDGFRFDLSKGFTQFDSGSNVNLWGNYDASRVATLKDYGDYLWGVDPESILILEHFADNSEETELANYGFMFWGNVHNGFKQSALGFSSESDVAWLSYQQRGWNNPHVLGYMESHDEERLVYENLNFGNSSGGYNVQNFQTALDRIEAASVIFFSIPGPKLIWQFGELGYDYSINYCTDGSMNNDCRTGRKPIAWAENYNTDTDRTAIYDVMSTLINLKTTYPSTFNTTDFVMDVGGLIKRINLNDDSGGNLDAVVLANFDVTAQSVNPNFPLTGEWFELFSETSITVTNPTALLNLQPGEYRIYTQNQSLSTNNVDNLVNTNIYPNPTTHKFYLDTEASNVYIYSVTGKLVKEFNGNFNRTSSFDISNLNTGVFIVQIKNKQGSLQTSKLVKL